MQNELENTERTERTSIGALFNQAEQRNSAPGGFNTLRSMLANGPAYVTNFKGNPQQTFEFLAKVQGGNSHKMTDESGASIDVRYWFAHKVELESKATGELTEVVRVALVDGGGEAWTAVSDGIVNGVDMLRQVFGDGPYTGQVVIKVQKVRTNSGMTTYNIVPA